MLGGWIVLLKLLTTSINIIIINIYKEHENNLSRSSYYIYKQICREKKTKNISVAYIFLHTYRYEFRVERCGLGADIIISGNHLKISNQYFFK